MPLPRPMTLAASAVPLWAVQCSCRIAFRTVMARHPGLFDRLGEYAGKSYVFAPTDLPFAFEIVPARDTIRVHRSGRVTAYDALVSGPMVTLLGLLEGRVDGDAVFFSRELTIEGDTEAVLALRNALDDSTLDLPTDLASLVGPFGAPVKLSLERVRERALTNRRTTWN